MSFKGISRTERNGLIIHRWDTALNGEERLWIYQC
jgi:hypothetical protein